MLLKTCPNCSRRLLYSEPANGGHDRPGLTVVFSDKPRPRRDDYPLGECVAGAGDWPAVTAIAAFIGAGGLGTFIQRGFSDERQLIMGALAVSILAVAADFALLGLQKRLTSPGLKTQ